MYKKIVCFLLLIIFICSSLLIYKINQTTKYSQEVYDDVYQEYEKIMSTNNNVNTIINQSSNLTYAQENKPIYTYRNSTGNTYRTVGAINISKINLSYPIINDYSESNLNIAPTKFVGPELNEVGNFVIVAHNNWNREFFSNLNKLEIGDLVNLTDHNNYTQTYKIYNIYETKQDDFSCLDQNTNGKVELTLITCIKYQKNRRLVVKCMAT